MTRKGDVVRTGITFGSALAMVISWTANKSLLWVISTACCRGCT